MAQISFLRAGNQLGPLLFWLAGAASLTAQDWEAQIRTLPEAARLRQHMVRMASEPHHAGSPASRAVAEYARDRFRSFGLSAEIETFEVSLPYPKTRVLEMTAPVRYTAKLAESAFAEDPDNADAGQLATFNAYAAAGDVTAPVVYVNYGRPEDYLQLQKLGVSVKGRIVLARYGKAWRGIKAKLAQEHGAAGCLIYSDPFDDGFHKGEVYPQGRYRPKDGVQRGSVMDMPLHTGDPYTPGFASEPGGKRLTKAVTLMRIPVLPISAEDAEPLLKHLTGPEAPASWRGALPLTYRVGPGGTTAHLKLDFDTKLRPVHDVIARLPGTTEAGQWILYGNHHDAWVNGAADPISGASAVLETARTLSELAQRGWRPKRTMVFALWDAEEFGIIGSTEWVEKHEAELRQRAAVYLNSDTVGAGPFSGGGSPSLRTFTAKLLKDFHLLDAKFKLGALGAGSDYVPFVHHVGIASLNYAFDTDMGGVYHSIHDTLRWYEKFGDPGFLELKRFTELMATAIFRFADADLLPFDAAGVADAVDEAIQELGQPAPAVTAETVLLRKTAAALAGRQASPVLNQALFLAERELLAPKGLPGRPWYRYLLSAPGMTTGYGARTLPGVFEGGAGSRPGQLKLLAAALRAYRLRLEAALQ